MTSMELLEAIGSVRDKYVLEAHSASQPQGKRISVSRTFLIAAIIALMLLLVGCVAVFLGLREMKIGETAYSSGGTGELISLGGYAGTPEYMAAKEWYEFEQSYDQDLSLMQLSAYDDYVEPEEYRIYNCYTREMVEKVDAICETYNLKRIGKCYDNVTHEEICEMVGIPGILAQNAAAETKLYNAGYVYEDGSFSLEGETNLTGEAAPWVYTVDFQYLCYRKGGFKPFRLNVGEIAGFTQWNYTTPDGTEVLLALSPEKALIIADKETCFVTVNILSTRAGDVLYGEQSMDQAGLEAIADTFDFSYTIQEIDTREADRREAERQAEFDAQVEQTRMQNRRGTYAEYFENFLNTTEGIFYSQLDLDGNGVEEVAYYWSGGSYYDLFTIADGYVTQVDGNGYAIAGGYLLCRGENGEYVLETSKNVGQQNYVSYLSLEDLELRYAAFLKYDPVTDPENPWFVCTNAPGQEVYEFLEMPMYWENVAVMEFSRIRESYRQLNLRRMPIANLIAPSETLEGMESVGGLDLETVVAQLQETYPDKELKSEYHDFNGSGYGDLAVWYDGAFRSLHLTDENGLVRQEYHFENGFEIYETYGQGVNQVSYEGSLIGIVEEQDGVEYHKFFRCMSNLYLRECLKYDPNGTESKWFAAATESWDTLYDAPLSRWEPITEAEYRQRLDAYQVQAGNLKPIAQWYLR